MALRMTRTGVYIEINENFEVTCIISFKDHRMLGTLLAWSAKRSRYVRVTIGLLGYG